MMNNHTNIRRIRQEGVQAGSGCNSLFWCLFLLFLCIQSATSSKSTSFPLFVPTGRSSSRVAKHQRNRLEVPPFSSGASWRRHHKSSCSSSSSARNAFWNRHTEEEQQQQQQITNEVEKLQGEEVVTVTDHLSTNNKQNLKPRPIATIECMDDFFKVLAEDERLVIVKFHANWCKSCQAFGVKYNQLARQYSDLVDSNNNIVQKGRVRFAQVEFTSNIQLCRSLDVKRLPYIHMYRGSDGLLTEFACGPKRFHLVLEALEEYLEDSTFEEVMEEGQQLLNNELNSNVQQQPFSFYNGTSSDGSQYS